MPIVWQAPTHNLPKSFRIYRRLPPRPFLATVISNAIVLASLQDRGFPKPSTNAFYIWGSPDPCGMAFSIFSIEPGPTRISFCSTNQNLLTNDIPDEETATRRAYDCAARFGLDRAHLMKAALYTSSSAVGQGDAPANGICGRGVVLARNFDGTGCFNFGNGENEVEGFSIEFGSRGQIRSFSLIWPNLEPAQERLAASPQEIVRSIRERKVLVLPDPPEPDYFGRLKILANAKRFTIVQITPCYAEGLLGEVPANDAPPQFVAPFAELEAVADVGNTRRPVRLLTPILKEDTVPATEPQGNFK